MDWPNLIEGKCPKCASKVKQGMLETVIRCTNKKCDFSISENKYSEILNDRTRPKKRKEKETDNLSGLNNLGEKEVAEDFSDSPALDL